MRLDPVGQAYWNHAFFKYSIVLVQSNSWAQLFMPQD